MVNELLPFLAKGLVLGFVIAVPVGPIGVLCFRRALDQGFWPAVAGGLGTAAADAAYAGVAAFGIAAVASVLIDYQRALAIAGGTALLWLGWRILRAAPTVRAAAVEARGLAAMFAATFLLTLANPTTILSFAALFAGLGLIGSMRDAAAASMLTAGVFAGSMLWWIFLSGAVTLLRARVPRTALFWVNRVSGLLLVAFGAYVLATVAVLR